jgi:hypothetical protein
MLRPALGVDQLRGDDSACARIGDVEHLADLGISLLRVGHAVNLHRVFGTHQRSVVVSTAASTELPLGAPAGSGKREQDWLMGGMAFHAAEFMAIALDARDRAAEERRSDRTKMAPDALVSVLMAAAATEAFINELGAYYELTYHSLEPRETATGVALAEVERSRGSTEQKYLRASLSLSGRMFDRSTRPFQDFSTLMKIRNGLMHPKPLDEFDDADVMVPPSYVREFERRGLTYQRDAGVSVSWLNLLETEQIASWACQAAVEIIVAVVEMTPPDGVSATIGRSFSEHYRPRAYELAPHGDSPGGAATP